LVISDLGFEIIGFSERTVPMLRIYKKNFFKKETKKGLT